jgi:L-threonylcarbamoyladenylate synthase
MAEIGTDIDKAVEWLQTAVIGLPTETVYGLAGNALDSLRVADIFRIKQRPYFDPLIVHVHDVDALNPLITDFPEPLMRLADRFWPGPLTLLLPRSVVIPDLTCAGLERAAFRVPAHPLALQLLRNLDFPLAAPSANPFGYISPTTALHVEAQLGAAIPYILDGSACKVGLESTIVGMEGSSVVIYRLGGLPVNEIEKYVGKCEIRLNESSNPRAPGMLKSHYAPNKKMLLGSLDVLLKTHQNESPILIVFGAFRTDYPEELQLNLSLSGNFSEAATNLFAFLRKADGAPQHLILAELLPADGLGLAINDRLKRASMQE